VLLVLSELLYFMELSNDVLDCYVALDAKRVGKHL